MGFILSDIATGIARNGVGQTVSNALNPNINILGAVNPYAQNVGVKGATTTSGASTTKQPVNNTPAPPVYTGGAGNTAATGASSAGSQADIASYQDQLTALQQLLQSQDTAQNNGIDSINRGWVSAENQLQGNRQNTLNQYNTQRDNTTQDYSKAIQRINTNARQGYNSLQALLGGTGSAGDVLAPYAVSQQANSQRGTSADQYARNLRNVDEGVAAAEQNFKNQQKGLEGKKMDSIQQLIASINERRMGYQQQMGAAENQLRIAQGGSYATPKANNDAIARLLAQNQALPSQYAQPDFAVQDYVAPQLDLAGYQSQAARLAGANNQTDEAGADDTATALAQLLKQQKQDSGYSY